MYRLYLITFFLLFFGSTSNAQTELGTSDAVSIERLTIFLLEEYDMSLAHSEQLKEIAGITLIKGDKNEFLAQFDAHHLYEIKVIGDEILLRMYDKNDLSTTYNLKIISSVDNKPVELAAVAVTNTSVGDYTNEHGEIELIVPSHFKNESFEIQMMGFKKKVVKVVATKQKQTFVLMPASFDVEEVIVEDKISPINSSTEEGGVSINPNGQLLSTGNIAGADILRSVQVLPGIASFEDNSAGIKIRGSNYDQTLIRVDGIPIYNSGHYFGIFSNINPLYADRLVAYKNNLPIEVGGRNGGLVDVYSKQDTSLSEVEGELDLNLLSSLAMFRIPLTKGLQMSLAGRTTLGNVNNRSFFNLFDDQSAGGEIIQNFTDITRNAILGATPDFSFYDLQGNVLYELNEQLSFSMNYFQSADELRQRTTTNFNERRRFNNNFRNEEQYVHQEDWSNIGYNFRINFTPSAVLKLSASDYTTSYEKTSFTEISLNRNIRPGTMKINQNFKSLNSIQESGFQVNAKYQVGKATLVTLGLDVIKYNTEIRNSDKNSSRLTLDRSANEIVPYTQLTHTFPQDWTLSLGGRASNYSVTDNWYLSPRIALIKRVDNNLSFKASAGRQYQFARMLDFENVNRRTLELWALGGTAEIPISAVDNIMIGGEYKSNRFSFDLELYQRNTEGVLNIALRNPQFASTSLLPDVRSDGYINYIGTGRTVGVDFMVSYTGRNYSSYIAYTLSKSTESFSEIARGEDLPGQLDRRHQLTMSQNYDFGDWFVGTDFTLASGRPYLDLDKIDANDDRLNLGGLRNYSNLPDYLRLDLGFGYKFKISNKEISIKASLVNALGRENVNYLQYTFALPPPDDANAGTRGTNLGSTTNLLDRTLNLSANLKF